MAADLTELNDSISRKFNTANKKARHYSQNAELVLGFAVSMEQDQDW
jgi:hypothetical protein